MKEYWYWIELIGFDKDKKDFGAADFLKKTGNRARGISLLLYSVDFLNYHCGTDYEYELTNGVCSYYGHPYNEERKIQKWTNYDLKKLVSVLKSYNLKVVFSFFNLFEYYDDDGNVVYRDFLKQHREVLERTADNEIKNCICPIKNMNDGTLYGDFLISRSINIIKDYNFDGIMLADGISSKL